MGPILYNEVVILQYVLETYYLSIFRFRIEKSLIACKYKNNVHIILVKQFQFVHKVTYPSSMWSYSKTIVVEYFNLLFKWYNSLWFHCVYIGDITWLEMFQSHAMAHVDFDQNWLNCLVLEIIGRARWK